MVCRSFNVLYQCCFRRRKILESVRRLGEYLLVRLVDICHSARNRIQWNNEALDDSDVIWRRCYWLILHMTKRGCELWPRAPFCVSRFISRARKEGCVIWSCQGMELCIILWHVVMPQLHVDRPGYTNLRRCELGQTLGGIYIIVTMEDSMKKKRAWGAGRAFALAEDIVL